MSILDDINKHGYAIRTSLEYIDPRVVKCLFRIAKNNKIRYVDTKRWITHDIKFKSKYMKSFHRNYRKSTSDIKIYKNCKKSKKVIPNAAKILNDIEKEKKKK